MGPGGTPVAPCVAMKRIIVVVVAVLVVGRPFQGRRGEAESLALHAQSPPKQAVVDTSAGTFVIDLTPETAPN